MLSATFWGAIAASSLVLGAVLALGRPWPDRVVGLVLGFGAGALISAVSYELAEEGIESAGQLPVAAGLAAGALVYFLADRRLERDPDSGGLPLALGAFLDGIPEQAVLGIGLASGEPVSVALLVAIFMSNLPESIGATSEMLEAKRARGWLMRLWLAVAAVCTRRDRRRLRGRRRAVGRVAGRDQRLRGRRAARDAVRLDDPGVAPEGRAAGRARARAGLRRRRRALDRLSGFTPRG